MQNLLLTEGDIREFQYTTLLKGKYVKLRPQTKDFLDISNPRRCWRPLCTCTCLTVGDSILINYNNKNTTWTSSAKPNNGCIVDTDTRWTLLPAGLRRAGVREEAGAEAANNVGGGGGDGAAAILGSSSSNGGGGRGGGGAGGGGKGKEPEAPPAARW